MESHMIKLRNDELGYTPVAVCDICHQVITDVGYGAAVWRIPRQHLGDVFDVLHVHKGRCHDQADRQLVGEDKASWHELGIHLADLTVNLGPIAISQVNEMA